MVAAFKRRLSASCCGAQNRPLVQKGVAAN
jgi:hypothetical protein